MSQQTVVLILIFAAIGFIYTLSKVLKFFANLIRKAAGMKPNEPFFTRDGFYYQQTPTEQQALFLQRQRLQIEQQNNDYLRRLEHNSNEMMQAHKHKDHIPTRTY
jgi:hypothetical protein